MTTLDTHSFMKVDLFYFFSKWGILNEEIVLEIVIHTIVKIILQLRTRRKFFPHFLHIKWNGIPLKLFSKKLPKLIADKIMRRRILVTTNFVVYKIDRFIDVVVECEMYNDIFR